MKKIGKLVVVFLAVYLPQTVLSQDKIESERPSESIAAKTLKSGTFQTEVGFRRRRQNEQDKVWRTPNAVFRYGLLEKLEFRLESNIEKQKVVSKNMFRQGLRPVELGIKTNVIKTRNEAFIASVVAQLGLSKVASSEHMSEDLYHRIRLLFENKLTDKLKLNYNVGTEWDSQQQQQNFVASFAPEIQLGNKWETFIEVYSFFKKNETPESVVDAGFGYFVSKNCKLDVSSGIGLSSEAPKYFIDAGVSFSFNRR